jgi:cob(I)alamin adenosyltransferase
VVQFVKSEKWKVGERKLAEQLGIEWHTLGDGFTWESTDMDETVARGRHAWAVAADKIASGDYDLVILDEVTYTMKYGWVEVQQVVGVLRDRPERTNVVVTGRYAPDEIVAIADTVTEMVKVKHAMDDGTPARKGIEY